MKLVKPDVRVRYKADRMTDCTSGMLAKAEELEREAAKLKKEALRGLRKPVKERDTRRILQAWAQHLDKLKEARKLRMRATKQISGRQ